MRRALRVFTLLSVFLVPPIATAQTTIEILTLKNRRAEDLVATLAALAGPDGAVTAHGGRLVVRARPAAMARIKAAIRSIDEPARMVVVTVRQSREQVLAAQSASVTVESRGEAKAPAAGPKPAPAGTEPPPAQPASKQAIAADRTETEDASHVTQVLRIMEGARAFIAVGSAVPVTTPPSSVPVAQAAPYVEAETGFFVVPHLTQEGFTLEISAQQEDADARGRVEGASLSTTVEGTLGRWIHLGTALRGRAQSSTGPLLARICETIDERAVELKVDAP
jgi:hypothetical protein